METQIRDGRLVSLSRCTQALHRPCTFNDGISVGKWRLALPLLVSESFRIELSFNEFRYGPYDANLACNYSPSSELYSSFFLSFFFFSRTIIALRVSSRGIGLRVAKGSHVERRPATLPPYTGCWKATYAQTLFKIIIRVSNKVFTMRVGKGLCPVISDQEQLTFRVNYY